MVAEIRRTMRPSGPRSARSRPASGLARSETVRERVRWAETDSEQQPGTTTEESAELGRLRAEVKRLRAEVKELLRASEILKAASAFSPPEGIRSQLSCSTMWIWSCPRG